MCLWLTKYSWVEVRLDMFNKHLKFLLLYFGKHISVNLSTDSPRSLKYFLVLA